VQQQVPHLPSGGIPPFFFSRLTNQHTPPLSQVTQGAVTPTVDQLPRGSGPAFLRALTAGLRPVLLKFQRPFESTSVAMPLFSTLFSYALPPLSICPITDSRAVDFPGNRKSPFSPFRGFPLSCPRSGYPRSGLALCFPSNRDLLAPLAPYVKIMYSLTRSTRVRLSGWSYTFSVRVRPSPPHPTRHRPPSSGVALFISPPEFPFFSRKWAPVHFSLFTFFSGHHTACLHPSPALASSPYSLFVRPSQPCLSCGD